MEGGRRRHGAVARETGRLKGNVPLFGFVFSVCSLVVARIYLQITVLFVCSLASAVSLCSLWRGSTLSDRPFLARPPSHPDHGPHLLIKEPVRPVPHSFSQGIPRCPAVLRCRQTQAPLTTLRLAWGGKQTRFETSRAAVEDMERITETQTAVQDIPRRRMAA